MKEPWVRAWFQNKTKSRALISKIKTKTPQFENYIPSGQVINTEKSSMISEVTQWKVSNNFQASHPYTRGIFLFLGSSVLLVDFQCSLAMLWLE